MKERISRFFTDPITLARIIRLLYIPFLIYGAYMYGENRGGEKAIKFMLDRGCEMFKAAPSDGEPGNLQRPL